MGSGRESLNRESLKGVARECDPESIDAEHRISNLILAALPKNEYEVVLPHLEFLQTEWHRPLYEPDVPIKFGYFPNGGIVSLIVPFRDGRSAEVGMVGREGFVGASLIGGLKRTPHTALVQAASTAARLSADTLSTLLPSVPTLHALLVRHALVQGMQVAQTAACNRLHDLPQRLARWLLMTQDRLNCNVLPYTQELLAIILGTGRPSVSVAVGALERNGGIDQKRGEIEILDTAKLQALSCECYAVMRAFSG